MFCTQTFIALRTLKNDSLKCLKCVWTCCDTCIYTHRYAYAQAMYIHIQARSISWIWLNMISNSVQLLYIQYEMSRFVDVNGVKNQTSQVFLAWTQSTLLNRESQPLTHWWWMIPTTDRLFKGSHKCLWCMCLFFKVQNNNNNYNYNNKNSYFVCCSSSFIAHIKCSS